MTFDHCKFYTFQNLKILYKKKIPQRREISLNVFSGPKKSERLGVENDNPPGQTIQQYVY